MRRLALIAALIVLTASQARAAEAVPGSSCAGYNANSFQWAGASQNGGVVNGMFCNGGTNLWTGAVNFQSTGNVGIGTTSPAHPLSVVDSSANGNTITAQSTSTSGYAEFSAFSSTGAQEFTLGYGNPSGGAPYASEDYLFFVQDLEFVNNSNVVTAIFKQGGNVGIGQTSPATKLDVNGDITNENVKSCAQLGTDSTGKLVCQTPAMVLISTQTASVSASLLFSGANWSSSYNTLFLNCTGIRMSAQGNGVLVRVGEGAGPTWESGATYAVVGQVNTATDLFNGAVAQPSGTTSSQNLRAYLNSVSSSTLYKSFTWSLCQADAYNGQGCSNQGGWIESWWRGDTNPVTGLEILASAGTITSGTCSLYGMN